MYGSPEARIWPKWFLTQNSHALRIRETSSLGRLAWTCRSMASNRSSMGNWSLGGLRSGTRAATRPWSPESGEESGTSAGIGCRTVAMLHYRLQVFIRHHRAEIPALKTRAGEKLIGG